MKKAGFKIGSFLICQILLLPNLTANAQELKDVDGNTYKTVSYGRQTLTASNLNVSHFRNGDVIPQALTEEDWINAGVAGKPAWCYYDNNPENGNKYGKLYNWFAISDKRGLAPAGWHIPANADWSILIQNLQGVDVAGIKLKSKTDWKSKKGTDNIGFAAIPGGFRDIKGKFKDLETTCQWWSNSAPVDVTPSEMIFSVNLSDDTPEIRYFQSNKGTGFSVRCVKD